MPKKEKTFRRKVKKTKSKNKAAPSKMKTSSTDKLKQITDHLLQAEADINTFNYESAIQHCQDALAIDPNNVEALELLAGILMEGSEIEQAENLYLQCIELSPDEGFSKYFSLGQISTGNKSLEYYRKGISIVETMLENDENEQPKAAAQQPTSLKRLLSDAYCSVAELYTTDLCDEEDAESCCENALQTSIKTDDSNPEAYQCLANLRLIQEKDEEARSHMSKSLSFWLPVALDEDTTPELELATPDYESRIKTSQLLVELGMFQEATQVLERLLSENDKVFTVWYLIGWTNYIQGDIYKRNAYYYFKKAKEIAKANGCDDKDQLKHVEELLKELTEEVKSDTEDEIDGAIEELNISSESEEEMDS